MSIFTETGSNQDQPQTEQAPTTEATTESFVERLVKAKGENWKDPETLAKGKLEADNYISQLEEQNRQLREDLGKNDYASQIIDAIKNKAADTSTAKDLEAEPNTVAELIVNSGCKKNISSIKSPEPRKKNEKKKKKKSKYKEF